MLTMPMTAITRATMSSGRRRLNMATAKVQPPRIRPQSSSDPSWPPHTAEIRYSSGNAELEFCAT